jgi:hypothetical protein
MHRGREYPEQGLGPARVEQSALEQVHLEQVHAGKVAALCRSGGFARTTSMCRFTSRNNCVWFPRTAGRSDLVVEFAASFG